MAERNTTKKPRCQNHRRRLGRVVCSRCGAWLCRECAVETNGVTVCRDRTQCHPPESALTPTAGTGTAIAPTTLRQRALRGCIWTAVGIVLASVSFFPHSFRTATRLRMQLRVTAGKNVSLAAALRESLANARDLESELQLVKDSALGVLDECRRGRRLSRHALSTLRFDSRLPASLDNGNRALRVVALTFDGGGDMSALRDILDTLHSRRVKATMFLTGGFIRHYPRAVRAILKGGHEVGNHTYTHPHLTTWGTTLSHATYPGVNRATIFNELGRTARAFSKLTGREMAPLWRAPYGERNRQVCRWAQEAGYLHVGWRQGRTWMENLDSNDWVVEPDDPLYHSPEEVLRKILAAADRTPYGINGGIILMHLGTLRKHRKQQVHYSLGMLIDRLREKGYAFVTVSEMAGMSGIDLTLLGGRDLRTASKAAR